MSILGSLESTRLFLFGFIGIIGLIMISMLIMLLLSFRAQHKYNNDILPDIEDDEELGLPELDDGSSVFVIDDEDGNGESEDYLRELRTANQKHYGDSA